jgi:hypothetical protein
MENALSERSESPSSIGASHPIPDASPIMTAPMPNPSEGRPERLDSWKAIAQYLGRDVRTVRRWESTLNLPIRRVPGGRGSSVFAYVSEIETWMQRTPTVDLPATVRPNADESRSSRASMRWWWILVSAAVLAIAVVVWRLLPDARASGLDVHVTPAAIVATDRSNVERWRYTFPPRERVVLPNETPWLAPNGGRTGVFVLLGNRTRQADDANLGGQLLRLEPDGKLSGTFSFEDQVTFRAGRYGPPWVFPSFRIDDHDKAQRIAVAAHHDEWWPGAVIVLDARLNRRGTFVNAGWIEAVRWMPSGRLVIAGFSNARDGGMAALLDANAANGQSPEPPDSPFHCETCGPDRPLRYFVFPRSELNRVTGSSFNRARLSIAADRIVVRTDEVVEADQTVVDAIYEFSPALELLQASFSDRYWDMHQALEAQGKIHHTRDACPDRAGPRAIQLWEPATGWKAAHTR